MWRFPTIRLPPNHPILMGFSTINHPLLGAPLYGNHHVLHRTDVRDEAPAISSLASLGGGLAVPGLLGGDRDGGCPYMGGTPNWMAL